MGKKINISYKENHSSINLPYSTKKEITVILSFQGREETLAVNNFPTLMKIALPSSQAFIRGSIALNMVSQRLVVEADEMSLDDMDSFALGELDIGQNKTYYSI